MKTTKTEGTQSPFALIVVVFWASRHPLSTTQTQRRSSPSRRGCLRDQLRRHRSPRQRPRCWSWACLFLFGRCMGFGGVSRITIGQFPSFRTRPCRCPLAWRLKSWLYRHPHSWRRCNSLLCALVMHRNLCPSDNEVVPWLKDCFSDSMIVQKDAIFDPRSRTTKVPLISIKTQWIWLAQGSRSGTSAFSSRPTIAGKPRRTTRVSAEWWSDDLQFHFHRRRAF